MSGLTKAFTIRPFWRMCSEFCQVRVKAYSSIKLACSLLTLRKGCRLLIAAVAFREAKVHLQQSFLWLLGLWCGDMLPPKTDCNNSRGSRELLVADNLICKVGVVFKLLFPYPRIGTNPTEPSPSINPARYANVCFSILSIIPQGVITCQIKGGCYAS